LGKWCKNKHGASKIIDTFETYQGDGWKGLNDAFKKGTTPAGVVVILHSIGISPSHTI
jgi:hypothetical protein